MSQTGFRRTDKGWVIEKTPESILDYFHDWSEWLEGDSIVESTWVATGDIVIANSNRSGAICTVWLQGGTNKRVYTITNRIVTAAGRTTSRSFLVSMKANISG